MNTVCARCARLSLLQDAQLLFQGQTQLARRFSSSNFQRDDSRDTPVSRGPPKGRERNEKDSTRPAYYTFQPGTNPAQFPSNPTQRSSERPTERRFAQRSPTPTGETLKRSSPMFASRNPPGTVLRRTAPQIRSGPPDQVLRSTRPPQRTGGAQGQTGRTFQKQGGRPANRRRTRPDLKPDDGDAGPIDEAALDARIDPPLNPTESILYTPKDTTMTELRADWPPTPLSATGMVETIQQKIEWLARRIPHGHQLPIQLAERYQQGQLIRFESEEEKSKVLELAKELAAKRAGDLSDRQGSVTEAEDMAFADLSVSTEKTGLADRMVRGVYPQLQKQNYQFLDTVVRTLRNNETYRESEATRFVQAVSKLVPPPKQQQQTAANQRKSA